MVDGAFEEPCEVCGEPKSAGCHYGALESVPQPNDPYALHTFISDPPDQKIIEEHFPVCYLCKHPENFHESGTCDFGFADASRGRGGACAQVITACGCDHFVDFNKLERHPERTWGGKKYA